MLWWLIWGLQHTQKHAFALCPSGGSAPFHSPCFIVEGVSECHKPEFFNQPLCLHLALHCPWVIFCGFEFLSVTMCFQPQKLLSISYEAWSAELGLIWECLHLLVFLKDSFSRHALGWHFNFLALCAIPRPPGFCCFWWEVAVSIMGLLCVWWSFFFCRFPDSYCLCLWSLFIIRGVHWS